MCNACGNVCCGSDEFGGCGCDDCEEPDCWSDDFGLDDRPDDEDNGFPPYDRARCCQKPAARFACEALDPSGNALRRA